MKNVVLLFALGTGKISVGEFFLLTYLFIDGIIKPLEQLGLLSGQVTFNSEAIHDIERLLKREPIESASTINPENKLNDRNTLILNSKLTLKHVSFCYALDLRPVLKDLNISIPVGTYTCVFGNSGCGKSTLLGLVEGFHWCSTGGCICLDGVNISLVLSSILLQHLGIVFQDTYVLDGTICENITFGYASRGHLSSNEDISTLFTIMPARV
jgi:ABC-type multidrug transport system fused ATPase/permease subunit